jgi:hypothetical protein
MSGLGLALALLLPPLLLLGWILVQNAWRRQFSQAGDDEDVLAARGGCGNCGCLTPCERADNAQRRASDRA